MTVLRVVCRPGVADGFALAGVRSLSAVDPGEASAVLGRLLEQPDTGVVLVEDTLYRGLSEGMREALERRGVPVVVRFPSPRREARPSAESELVELLRRAIGYRVRLR
jgi:vacuolar-type H+-ATPase subunit F/Vma7